MLGSLLRHSFLALLLAVLIEELGLPSPIPTDVMIVFASTTTGGSMPLLALYFVALSLASAVGGSGLYTIVRRGGRPLWTVAAATYTWDQTVSPGPRRCWNAAAGGPSPSAE